MCYTSAIKRTSPVGVEAPGPATGQEHLLGRRSMVDPIIAEEWRPVVGWEGWYEVSSLGRVRSLTRTVRRSDGFIVKLQGGMMIPSIHPNGRVLIRLQGNGKRLSGGVHRLVCAAFIGPCPPRHEVNHIDGDPKNNRVENLEWVTRSQNMLHAYANGLYVHTPLIGEANGGCKVSQKDAEEMRRLFEAGANSRDLAKKYGIYHGSVRNRIYDMRKREFRAATKGAR